MSAFRRFIVIAVAIIGTIPALAQTATPAPTATPQPTLYEGFYQFEPRTANTLFTYSGTWTQYSFTDAVVIQTVGGSVSFTAIGDFARIWWFKGANHSDMQICVNAACTTYGATAAPTSPRLQYADVNLPSDTTATVTISESTARIDRLMIDRIEIYQGHVVASSGGGPVMPDLSAGLYEAETTGVFTLTGSWVQVVDGAYSTMESATIGDTATLNFDGSEIIIYRELLASGGGDVEVCIDAACSTLSNTSISDQLRVPASYRTDGLGDGPYTLSIENTSGGTFRLDYVVIVGSESQLIGGGSSVSPSTQYITLETGRVVGVDFSINGGDIAQIIFLAFIAAVVLYGILIQRATPND